MKSIQLIGTACFALAGASAGTRPNVVILFADNLGAYDVSIRTTPNIATLGRDGVNFTNWNSAAHLCSASRAALLTGKYPVRTGVYPGVFKTDASNGLPKDEVTLGKYLQDVGYSTCITGKWHLGHREDFLPTSHGFDEWLGIPFPMSGGSMDNHTRAFDTKGTLWLPLYRDAEIIQQPVNVQSLADTYADHSSHFIHRNAQRHRPFFLYMAFSHVHQLCAPRDYPEQETCQWAGSWDKQQTMDLGRTAGYQDAVLEMDWIAGRILSALKEAGVANNTIVLFTSDNGPWVAEQSCSGKKGPYQGQWLRETTATSCTACPLGYVSSPTELEPRRCVLPGTAQSVQGVHCGEDSGLGSTWEANLRMPALVRWPGRIPAGRSVPHLVSTLDVVPTILRIVGMNESSVKELRMDGKDIGGVILGENELTQELQDRVLFFWRDGFSDGPLPAPFGRFDVVAAKVGRIKAWIWTKSGHYNNDPEVHHDPPLLFDTVADPAESVPLDPALHEPLIQRILWAIADHKRSVNWTYPGPLTLDRDPKYIPCSNSTNHCRTSPSRDPV